MVDFLEWTGSLSGLAGAVLLATHSRISRYGWLAFLVANLAMIGFALSIHRYGLFIQQLGFMGTSFWAFTAPVLPFRFDVSGENAYEGRCG